MSTRETAASDTGSAPRYRRRLRNYLLDVGLQIRYTAFIIMVAVLLTAVLGYKIYDATQDTSKIIWMTGLVDPASAGELQAQFRANDRVVLFSIAGFGLLLLVSIAGVGIWITHKVAGPLFSIANICTRVRDNKLSPAMRQQLRKGDELQEFYSTFRDMYEALRTRAGTDVQVLGEAIARLERASAGSPALQESVEQLRRLQREKQASLEP
jgi:hypothetical protein